MKRALIGILSVLWILTCCLPCAVAEGTEADKVEPQYINVLDCETADGFSSPAEIAVDTGDYTEGNASLSFTISIPKDANATGSIEATFAPVDISYGTVLEFDFYISDPALLRASYIMAIDLGSAGSPDTNLMDWPSTAFDGITEAGWYHISLPFSEAINQSFDASSLNYFRLLFMNVNPQTDLTDVVVKLDNVRVSVPPMTTVLMDDCDSLVEGEWSKWMQNPVTRDPVNRTQGTASLDLDFIHTPQYNGWSMVCDKSYAPIDATNAVYLEMDVYISDVARMKNSQYGAAGIYVEITSSGECDYDEYSWALGDYVTENGWTHLRLPIAEAETVGADRGGAPEMSAINYLRFHILGVRGDTPIEFQIDNIFFSVKQDAEPPFYGATLIERPDDTPDVPETPEEPEEPEETPPVTDDSASGNDSTLRAEQTNRRAKILLLVMIFAIIGIDVVVMAVRRRNERTVLQEGELAQDPLREEGEQ